MKFTDAENPSAKHKPGNNVIRIIFCLVFAIILWLLNVLSENQVSTIPVQLNYITGDNQVNCIKLTEQVELTIRSDGWSLLKEYFNKRYINIDLGNYSEQQLLITNINNSIFSADLPSNFYILHVWPDTLNLQFADCITKTIPIKMHIQFSSTLLSIDSMNINPDSITITGAVALLKEIHEWPAEIITIDSEDSIYLGSVALENVDDNNIRMSAIAVNYQLYVATLLQHQIAAIVFNPITKKNETITVKYTTSQTDSVEIKSSDFVFETTLDSVSKHFNIIAVKYPQSAQNIKTEPTFLYLMK